MITEKNNNAYNIFFSSRIMDSNKEYDKEQYTLSEVCYLLFLIYYSHAAFY